MAQHIEDDDLPFDFDNLIGRIDDIVWDAALEIEAFVQYLVAPENLYQLLIAATLAALAYLAHAIASPRLKTWITEQETASYIWRGLLGLFNQYFGMFAFVAMMLGAVVLMHDESCACHNEVIRNIATLAVAWVAISVMTQAIQNNGARRIARIGLWVLVALYVTGYLQQVELLLNRTGLTIGTFNVSILLLLDAVIILSVLLILARIVVGLSEKWISHSKDISPSMQVLSIKMIQVILYTTAIITGLRSLGINLSGLTFLSGAIGVGLGFGLQTVVSNLVSGIIILLDKSVKPGDVISIGDTFGWIKTLGARYVAVVTRDGKEYLIPNEDLITGEVVNWSHSDDFVAVELHFSTVFTDSPHELRPVAVEAAHTVDRVLKTRPTVCHITGFGDSSINYVLRFWIEDPKSGLTNIRGDVYLALWDAFVASGFSLPEHECKPCPHAEG